MSQATINAYNFKTGKLASRLNNGNQLIGLIILVIIIIAISWEGWIVVKWIKDPHHLPLSKLIITGDLSYTTNDDIRQVILTSGALNNFLTQDTNIIQRQIERLPWIKKVNVHKRWPDRLSIHLVEYIPLAFWNDVYFLDKNGAVFSAPINYVNKYFMPMLYGPEGSEQDVLNGYQNMNKLLSDAKYQLKVVKMSVRNSWQLMLTDGVRIELGRDNILKRLQRFIDIYPVLLQQAINDNRHINYVDLRYDFGLAVG